jgi:hypothetical protein
MQIFCQQTKNKMSMPIEKSQQTKIFFDVNILKLSAQEMKKMSPTFLSERG